MPKIAHTTLRGGVYYINLKVPKELREAGAYGGIEKIVKSLETKEHGVALLKAPIRVGEIKAEFEELLQQLDRGGSLEPTVSNPSSASRRKARKKAQMSERGQCCFIASREGAVALAEHLAREYFIELLKASEADVEGCYTREDAEGLESILSDSRAEIEIYGRGVDHYGNGEGVEHVSGEKLMLTYLMEKGMAYSAEGMKSVAVVHDKFRRAVYEAAQRTEARVSQVVAAMRTSCPPDTGWGERFDNFFQDLDAHSQSSIVSGSLKPVAKPVVVDLGAGIREGGSIQELCEDFIEYKKPGLVAKSLGDIKAVCAYVAEVLPPDSLVSECSKEDARKIVSFISDLPKGIKTFVAGESLSQRVAKIAKSGRGQPTSEKTYRDKCSILMELFSFAEEEDYLHKNPFLGGKMKSYITSKVPDGKGRDSVEFTVDQLNLLFSRPIYTGHAAGNGGWKKEGDIIGNETGRYWAPLLMLFHGCRLNEVAQLMVTDIDTEGDIPYFRVSELHGLTGKEKTPKRLKTANSDRIVPIHRELIKCGFLDFVRDRKKSGASWLFPEWADPVVANWTLGDDIPEIISKHSDRASDHCLKLRNTVIDAGAESKPCNHSFRHMCRTALRVAGVAEKTVEALQGWSDGKGSMADHYGKFPLPMLKTAIDQVKYEGLNIGHLY